jgi:hypothetical protein
LITIDAGEYEVEFKQIAGLLAQRIGRATEGGRPCGTGGVSG